MNIFSITIENTRTFTMTTKTFKCVLIGNGGVGKTTFIERHVNGAFRKKYIPTLGVEVHPLAFNTPDGKIIFNMWDCAGQEKFMGLRKGYWKEANCAIVMFDLTSKNSFKSSVEWYNDFKELYPNVPVVVLGSKSDINDKHVSNEDVSSAFPGLEYVEVSTKLQHNMNSPFFALIKQ